MSSGGDRLTHGWQLQQAGKLAEAEAVYRAVLQSEPGNANAWCYLGMACHDQDRFDEAVAAYRRAIAIQPNFPIAYNNLGNSLRLQRRVKEAMAAFDEALRQKPDYLNAAKNKGTALMWEGFVDEALQAYERAVGMQPDDPETHKNIGVIRLLQGRFTEGWREYEWRLKAVKNLTPQTDRTRWQGESLDGRSILLVAEQGFGDTVHFIRYAAELKRRFDCRVLAAVQRPLMPLLSTCGGIDELTCYNDPWPPSEVWTPLLSVPGLLGHDSAADFPSQVPYLHARADLQAAWRERLAAYPGVKIGIAWRGSPGYQADRFRSIPLAALAPLGQLSGVHLFSLQKGDGMVELETNGAWFDIVSFGDQLDTHTGPFLDTAALMTQLDVVISADTVVGHIAGALGVPFWSALAHVPDWRWLMQGETSIWYPTARLFRQTTAGDWRGVAQRLADAVLAQFPQVRRKQPEEYRVATTGFNRLARTRHGLMLYNRHDVYIGRSLDRYGEFSEGELDLMRQLLRPGSWVVEVGANVGTHTLPLARAAGPTGRVIAFEPQRIVFQTLAANVALNSLTNVECRWEAAGAEPGSIVVPTINYESDNNFGGLELGKYATGERVPVTTVDRLDLPRCDLLKIDVEGMELDVLRGAAQTLARLRPVVYLENDRPENSPKLIEFLQQAGYRLYWHVPAMFDAANHYGNSTNAFPNLVSANMLGVHESVQAQIAGLRPIDSPQSSWQAPQD